MTPDQTARGRLEGQLRECEQHIAIYRDLYYDCSDRHQKWVIVDALDAMREHRKRIEQALDDQNY